MPIKQPDYEYEEDVLTAGEEKIEEPPLYKVMLHNDNFTTMEFVVFILQSVFGRSETEAVQVMLQVHLGGVGVAGTYSYEIAQMKVEKVTTLAREYEYPLLCTMEEN